MRRALTVTVLLIFVLFLYGCDQAGENQTSGYLLRSEEQGVEVLFLRYQPDQPEGSITGYMYIASPAANPSAVYLETWKIVGSVDGSRIFVQLEEQPDAEYTGVVYGDRIELIRGLTSWEGEVATLEEFGEAAEDVQQTSKEPWSWWRRVFGQ